MRKQIQYIPQKGMNQDLSISKVTPEYIFEGLNIRLNAYDDNTLFTITNEKGNILVNLVTEDTLRSTSILGTVIGYAVVEDYLVLFTTTRDTTTFQTSSGAPDDGEVDRIYRIKKATPFIDNNGDYTAEVKLLFSGTGEESLNFSKEALLETLPYFESEEVQKVYWVDKYNQPRFINIVSPRVQETDPKRKFNNQSFNFSSNLKLEEEITIVKRKSGGQFHSGVIQYAFSYWNLNGQESQIFYESPLNYITYKDRAGGPEDICSNSFDIIINNIDKRFDYLRIYSIEWTTLNVPGKSRIVLDIDLKSLSPYTNNTPYPEERPDIKGYKFKDDGIKGSNFDIGALQYIGSKELIVQTLATKDNTLFLGNISLKTPSLKDIQKRLLKTPMPIRVSTVRVDTSEHPDDTDIYGYRPDSLDYNTLEAPLGGNPPIKHWKKGETYRMGFQAQYHNGEWSDPVYFGEDVFIDKGFRVSSHDNITRYGEITRTFCEFNFLATVVEEGTQISSQEYWNTIQSELLSMGYRKIRPVYVPLSFNNRNVVAQGFVTPTIAKVKNRTFNSAFGYPDWYARPNNEFLRVGTIVDTYKMDLGTAEIDVINYMTAPTMSLPFTSVEIHRGKKDGDNFKDDQCTTKDWYLPNSFYAQLNVFQDSQAFLDSTCYTLFNHRYKELTHTASVEIIGESYIDPSNISWTRNIPLPLVSDHSGSSSKPTTDPNTFTESSEWGMWFPDKNLINFWSPEVEFGHLDHFDFEQVNQISFRGIANITNAGGLYTDFLEPSSEGKVGAQRRHDGPKSLRAPEASFRWNWIGTQWEEWATWSSDKRAGASTLPKFKSKVGSKYWISAHNYMFMDSASLIYDIFSPKIIDPELPVVQYKTSPSNFDGIINYNPTVEESYTVDVGKEIPIYYKSNKHILMSLDWKQHNLGDMSLGSTLLPEFIDPSFKVSAQDGRYDRINLWYKTPVYTTVGGNTYDLHSTLQFYLDPQVYLGKSFKNLVKTTKNQQGGNSGYSYLWLVDIIRKVDNQYGGKTLEDLSMHKWIPCGLPTKISMDKNIKFDEGDTYIQRYDCLRVYPVSFENEEQWQRHTDGVSLWLESFVNLDGRYDSHRQNTDLTIMTPANFNKNNPVYSQQPNFYEYTLLNHELLPSDDLPTTFLWSHVKMNSSTIDPWTTMQLSTNAFTVNGGIGAISYLEAFNNEIYGFQPKGIFQIMYNSRVQVPTSDNLPIELRQGRKAPEVRYLTEGIGVANKWGVKRTNKNLYFIDSLNKDVYALNNPPTNITENLGFKAWTYNNIFNVKEYDLVGNKDAFVLVADTIQDNLYITNENVSLMYSEQLQAFESFYSYEDSPFMFNVWGEFVATKSRVIDSTTEITSLWINHKGEYNKFFGHIKPSTIEFLINPDMPHDKVFDNFQYRADVFDKNNSYLPGETFDKVVVENEYQDINEKVLMTSSPIFGSKKFRTWSYPFPRETGTLNRIRNPWIKFKLNFENERQRKLLFHDLVITYTV